MKIMLVKRLSRCGGKYVFVVPPDLVKRGFLEEGKLYVLHVEEVESHA